jgi:hypothetical protein
MYDAAKTYDPRNLILEAYRIDGITEQDCRSIFLDWALGLKDGQDADTAVRALLGHYMDQPENHPMNRVLRDALKKAERPRRRGGATGRRG